MFTSYIKATIKGGQKPQGKKPAVLCLSTGEGRQVVTGRRYCCDEKKVWHSTENQIMYDWEDFKNSIFLFFIEPIVWILKRSKKILHIISFFMINNQSINNQVFYYEKKQ